MGKSKYLFWLILLLFCFFPFGGGGALLLSRVSQSVSQSVGRSVGRLVGRSGSRVVVVFLSPRAEQVGGKFDGYGS